MLGVELNDPFTKGNGKFDFTGTFIGNAVTQFLLLKGIEKTGFWGMAGMLGYQVFKASDVMFYIVEEYARREGEDEKVAECEDIRKNIRKVTYGAGAFAAVYTLYNNPKGTIANLAVNFSGDYVLDSVYARLPTRMKNGWLGNELFALTHVAKLVAADSAFKYFKPEKITLTKEQEKAWSELQSTYADYRRYREEYLRKISVIFAGIIPTQEQFNGAGLLVQVPADYWKLFESTLKARGSTWGDEEGGFSISTIEKFEKTMQGKGWRSHQTTWKKSSAPCLGDVGNKHLLIRGKSDANYRQFYRLMEDILGDGYAITIEDPISGKEHRFFDGELNGYRLKILKLCRSLFGEKFFDDLHGSLFNLKGWDESGWGGSLIGKTTRAINIALDRSNELQEFRQGFSSALLMIMNAMQILTIGNAGENVAPAADVRDEEDAAAVEEIVRDDEHADIAGAIVPMPAAAQPIVLHRGVIEELLRGVDILEEQHQDVIFQLLLPRAVVIEMLRPLVMDAGTVTFLLQMGARAAFEITVQLPQRHVRQLEGNVGAEIVDEADDAVATEVVPHADEAAERRVFDPVFHAVFFNHPRYPGRSPEDAEPMPVHDGANDPGAYIEAAQADMNLAPPSVEVEDEADEFGCNFSFWAPASPPTERQDKVSRTVGVAQEFGYDCPFWAPDSPPAERQDKVSRIVGVSYEF